MNIKKIIYDDKKEKFNSIELTIIVPTMEVPKEIKVCGGFVEHDEVFYKSYHETTDEANRAFDGFLEALSKYYNTHKSTFEVVSH